MSHFTGWQLIRLLQVFDSVATQWVFSTVSLANLLWLFLLGSCPVRCLLCCPLDGETQIWLGDLRLAFCFWLFCVLVFMICHAACDHLCPCRSSLNNSFFSCKDRALERDRPYQREKKILQQKDSAQHSGKPNLKPPPRKINAIFDSQL